MDGSVSGSTSACSCACIFQLWLLPVPAVSFPLWPGEARTGELELLWLCNAIWGCGSKVLSRCQHPAGRPGVLGRVEGLEQAVLLVLLRGCCLGTICLCCFPEQEQ